MGAVHVTATELAERVGAKRNGHGWLATCPAHEDHTPSLSIGAGADGRILLHCFAGCETETVVKAWGLATTDLFVEGPRGPDATYDYTDADGTVLYQVVRFQPKDFRVRRPDGAGGWVWNLGTRRVLYRLPELRAAIAGAKRVFVVEGEKDADAVRRHGFAATCNPGGAGKWRQEYTEMLRGADVVIVADKDAPGRAHAQQVHQALHGVAAKVVVVEAAEGKDASDHFAGGKRLGDLVPVTFEAVEKTAPPFSPSESVQALTHIRDLLAEPDDAVSWIVNDLLPAGGLSVFGGKPKGGKSTTARAIALRVCRGEPVLGRTTTKGPVIYLGLEDPRRVTKGHLRTLGARADDDLYVFTGARPDEAILWLESVLATVDPVLVVVDTLQHLLGVSDLNDYARVVAALGPVLKLVRSRRAHMMLVHHAGKGDRVGFDAILGSTAIVGTVDVALLLRRREDNTRTLTTLQRAGEDLPESVVVLDAHQEPRLEGTRVEYDAKQVGERVAAWLEQQSEWVTRKAIEEAVEGRADTIWQAVARLEDEGRVERQGAGKRGDPFLFRYSQVYVGIEKQKPETAVSSRDSATFSIPTDQGSAPPVETPGNRNGPSSPEAALQTLAILDPTGWDALNPAGAALLAQLEAQIERAAIQAEEAPSVDTGLRVERLADGSHQVTGGQRPHLVTADGLSCDCEDHRFRRHTCKHMLAVQGAA